MIERLTRLTGPGALRRSWLLALAATLLVAGCGGGESPPVTASGGTTTSQCDASNNTPETEDDCGEVIIGLTDAEGDFITYSVNVTSLTLVRADGAVVETLPRSARVDFAQYTEMTEFLAAASVPPGTYTAGKIRLNYADAEVFVEKGDDAIEALVVDAAGQALVDADFEIVLDNRRQLVVRRGLPSLLTVDFDLGASHEVDLSTSPADRKSVV